MKKYNWLFWLVYVIAAAACWASTYKVFAASDTPLVAGLAATSVDGVLALTLYLMGKVKTGDQRNVALIGTLAFSLISAVAQIIQRFTGLGVEMPYSLRIVSLFLVPASTTGAVVLLGVLKYFDRDGNGIPDFMEKSRNKQNPNMSQQHSQQIRPAFEPDMHKTPNLETIGNNGGGLKQFSTEMPTIGELRRQDGSPFPTKPRS